MTVSREFGFVVGIACILYALRLHIDALAD
jgi:hypothetical protein